MGKKERAVRGWPKDPAVDLELHIAFQDHHQLIDCVGVVVPRLAGRIRPDIATEAAGQPILSGGFKIHHGRMHLTATDMVFLTAFEALQELDMVDRCVEYGLQVAP